MCSSDLGAQLKMNVANLEALHVVLTRVAESSKQESDIAAAKAIGVQVEAAQKLYDEHVAKQALVDKIF